MRNIFLLHKIFDKYSLFYRSQVWKIQPVLQVASLWLALDDVTIENGAMDMFPFSTLPQV